MDRLTVEVYLQGAPKKPVLEGWGLPEKAETQQGGQLHE